jgi:hypothetical protein
MHGKEICFLVIETMLFFCTLFKFNCQVQGEITVYGRECVPVSLTVFFGAKRNAKRSHFPPSRTKTNTNDAPYSREPTISVLFMLYVMFNSRSVLAYVRNPAKDICAGPLLAFCKH